MPGETPPAVPVPEAGAVRDDVLRLYAAVVHWSPTKWAGRAADGRSRADVATTLVLDLATLGIRAGSGAPEDARPGRLGAHALADQLLVLGAELVTAPGLEDVAGEARAALATTRRLLLG